MRSSGPVVRLLLLLSGILISPLLRAQIDTATVAGRITDATGATVAGADVTVTNTETNFAYHAKSNTSGEWTISPVHIGRYRLTVTSAGFSRAEAPPFTLSVQQRQQIDLALQAGAVSSTVEVTETAPVLETATSERSQLIDSRTMQTLPLNGRNPVQLAQLKNVPLVVASSAAYPYDTVINFPYSAIRADVLCYPGGVRSNTELTTGINMPADWVVKTLPAYNATQHIPVYAVDKINGRDEVYSSLPLNIDTVVVTDGLRFSVHTRSNSK